ncbi:hypothetical protein, partial [uncultured Polaribacter sp.]|uniref:hypothetical protein n=1 Tax=uncultured Polaribacter sp. TaxID=174711 RepID=UPI00260E2BBE
FDLLLHRDSQRFFAEIHRENRTLISRISQINVGMMQPLDFDLLLHRDSQRFFAEIHRENRTLISQISQIKKMPTDVISKLS